MDRFLKRTEHPVSPVLPAPNKARSHKFIPNKVSASFRAQEFGLSSYESGGKLFCKSCNLVFGHFGQVLLVRSYRKNYQTYLMK